MKAVSAQAVSCCVYFKPQNIMQHMHCIIPYMFDCWANRVDHLLLLKTSMPTLFIYTLRSQILNLKDRAPLKLSLHLYSLEQFTEASLKPSKSIAIWQLRWLRQN